MPKDRKKIAWEEAFEAAQTWNVVRYEVTDFHGPAVIQYTDKADNMKYAKKIKLCFPCKTIRSLTRNID